MKRIWALLLAMLLIFSLVACSTSDDDDDDSSRKSKKDKETSQSAEADEEEEEEEEETAKEEKEEAPQKLNKFEEIIVVDNDDCTIKITDLKEDDFYGLELKVYLENKTDKELNFDIERSSIDGVQSYVFLYEDVAAGKKSNVTAGVDIASLEEFGLKTATDIELCFEVTDANDYSADPVAEATVHVYPYGEEQASVFERTAQKDDVVLVDNDEFTVIVTGYQDTDDYYGFIANIYIVNKTDKNISVVAEDTSVNGYMLDGFLYDDVYAGKQAFVNMSWPKEEMEKNDISKVELIEFVLSISDADDWFADDYVNEEITLEP